MLKKSLIFASLALLLGTLIVINCSGPNPMSVDNPGRETPADNVSPDEDGGEPEPEEETAALDGPNLTPSAVEDAVENYPGIEIMSGSVLPAGFIDFKDARVKVFGAISTAGSGTVINAAGAQFEWEGGAKITLNAGDVFIYADGFDLSMVDNSNGAVLLPLQSGTITTGPHFAVKGPLTISAAGPTSADTIAAGDLHGKTLYVAGDLTAAADFSANAVTVFGDITFGAGSLRVTGGALAVTGRLIAGAGSTAIALSDEAHSFRGITGLAASVITTGTKGITVNGAVENAAFADGAVINGEVEFTGTNSFNGEFGNSAESTYIFNSPAVINGTLITGTGGFTIAGKDKVTLKAAPKLDADLTISSTGGVMLANNSDFSKSTADFKINDGGKLILATGKVFKLGVNSGRILSSTTTDVTFSSSGTDGGAFRVADGDITITANPDGATVSGGRLMALDTHNAAKPAITVEAGKMLTIDTGTEISLGGTTSVLGSIILANNGHDAAKIAFAGPGAKLSTTATTANAVKVTAPIRGTITLGKGAVGTGLDIYSTASSGSNLKMIYVTPAPNASFDGTSNAIFGPTLPQAGNTRISNTITVTDS